MLKAYLPILRLVWPLALGMVNNAVMQFVDRTYLSYDSLTALEAVLPAGLLMWIFAGFFHSIVGYSSVFVGQAHGAGDAAGCRAAYRAALVLAVFSGILSLPLVPLGQAIFRWTAASPEVMAMESSYFTVMTGGSVFLYLQMAAAASFTGRGRTRIVFWVNLLGNVLNVALDPLFIFTFGLGIAGAAYATVLSTAVQTAVLVFIACRERAAVPAGTSLAQVGEKLRGILRFGVPSGFCTVLNLLSFTVFVFVTGGVGELELAVSNACFTVNYLLFAPMEGFALGASTLVAQAIGRGDPDGAVRDARRTMVLGLAFVSVLSALSIVFAHPVLSLFASRAGASAAQFHALGFTLLLLLAAWQVFDAAEIILCGALKGAGDTRFVMLWTLLSAFVLWLPLVFVVRACHNTMPALWLTMVVDVVVRCIGTYVRWRRGAWRKISLCRQTA